ncbi:MAG: FtsX-like permease family protein [Bacteroidales bacterium]|nr:FtsX-like permease family protein [Bacteroidales bacterium]
MAFTYYFLEDYINNMYQSDRASGRLFSIFTLLAIIIACVGLFGLASYSTQQRIKEIGIRKVMGSSISKIVLLLSTDFVKLIIGAFLISIPIGILSMKFWLKNFSFSTNISLMIFVYAGLLSLVIALITISYHTIRSASTNPSDTLRHE